MLGRLVFSVLGGWASVLAVVAVADEPLQFNRDVRPILSDNCFRCHGFDKNTREADLRLDLPEAAYAETDSGTFPIVPGKPEASEILRRITSDDPDERMPPPDSHQTIKPEQIATLRRWITEGAAYQPHWAFIAPVRPELPQLEVAAGQFVVRNPIDAFIAARLLREGLAMSPEADKITLIRRVTLDLIGLPPTPQEVDAFVADTAPDAYDRLVDRLLASPHYGERMALPWLDAARYADSNGFQQDGDTYQYVWRDWVVQALNANMPFDQFTIEQLAGDLLPNPTDNQKIATGFNRCHMLNGEGGAIAEEQRNVIVHDRVDVTATNWLGLTITCAQCHDHKYDPITQRDYYQIFAFFNNVPESGTPAFITSQYRVADPWIFTGTEEENDKLKAIEVRLAAAAEEIKRIEQLPETLAAQRNWEASLVQAQSTTPVLKPWNSLGPFSADNFDSAYDTPFDPEREIALDKTYADGALRWTPRPEWEDAKPHVLEGPNAATYLYREIHSAAEQPVTFSLGSDDAIKVWFNGVRVVANKALRGVAADQDRVVVTLQPGVNALLIKIANAGGIGGFYFRAIENTLPDEIRAIAAAPPESRDEAATQKLRDYFLTHHAPSNLIAARSVEQQTRQELESFRGALPRVMIMSDAQPRQTHVLLRGNYEAPGDEVSANTPAAMLPLPEGAPKNRLGLAQWLVGPQHPLTARVQVNRYWQLFFGKGLVKTAENFGLQSDQPTHPQLLDWLAVEFRESGWNVKHLHRLIVTSATYRQSSRVSPELLARDAENELYARSSRFRMPSLLLRDVALAASGLLDPRMGGKPVYPYQPPDIWDGLAITKERDFTYPLSQGNDLYRRSLYTFWRRTVAPGNMFDASVRNVCKVRTSITCTPLHALTTLNDVTWVEAGRALAQRVMQQSSVDPDARLTDAFRRVCARAPRPDELAILRRGLDRALAAYRADPTAANEYLAQGASPRDAALDPAEHAAYASVCLQIFNLDEALTRE